MQCTDKCGDHELIGVVGLDLVLNEIRLNASVLINPELYSCLSLSFGNPVKDVFWMTAGLNVDKQRLDFGNVLDNFVNPTRTLGVLLLINVHGPALDVLVDVTVVVEQFIHLLLFASC